MGSVFLKMKALRQEHFHDLLICLSCQGGNPSNVSEWDVTGANEAPPSVKRGLFSQVM